MLLIDVLIVIKEAKELVSWLKTSGKMLELTSAIPSDSTTRWSFLEEMVTKLEKNFQQVRF